MSSTLASSTLRRSSPGFAFGIVPVLTLVGFVVLPILAAGFPRAFDLSVGAACAWMVILYSTLRLTVIGLKGEKMLVRMSFWVFTYTFFGLVPLVQITAEQNSLKNQYSSSLLAWSFGTIILGLVSFEFGLLSASRPAKSRARSRVLSLSRVRVLGLVSLVMTPFLIATFGGFEQLFVSRNDRLRALSDVTGGDQSQVWLLIVKSLTSAPAFVAFLALLTLYLQRHDSAPSQKSRASRILIFLLGLTAIIVNNPVSTGRYLAGTVILSIMFVVIPWRRAYSLSLTSFAIALLFIIIFPFADVFRNTLEVELTGVIQESSYESQIVGKSDYDSFEQVVNAISYVDREGLRNGRQILGTVLFWFPRQAWPGKPVPSGQLVAEFRGTQNLNLSMPLWGELFLDGHLPAVIIGLFLYGRLVAKLDAAYTATLFGRPDFTTLFVPGFTKCFSALSRVGDVLHCFCDRCRIVGVEHLCCTRVYFDKRAGITTDHWASVSHSLQRGQPKTLVERRIDKRRSLRV